MKNKSKQLYVEIVTERVGLGPKGIVASSVRKATQKDIQCAKVAHKGKNPHNNEKHTVFYDEDFWPYYARKCGICDAFLSLI